VFSDFLLFVGLLVFGDFAFINASFCYCPPACLCSVIFFYS